MISDNLMRVVEAQGKVVTKSSVVLTQFLINLWRPYKYWTDYDRLIAQSARSASILGSSMSTGVRGQRAYLKMIAKEMKLTMPPDSLLDNGSIIIDGSVSVSPREINPLDQWQRPAEQYRWNISQGATPTEALEKALERVSTMAKTDMLLARRNEMRNILSNIQQVTGYRRIIHPELAKDGQSCGLCVVASQRKYKTKNLLPIHDDCNCDVLPITEDFDPGRELNDEDLQKIYDAAGSTAAGDLLKTKVSFLDHGELGPILVNGNRSKKALAEGQAARAKEVKSLSTLESLQEQLRVLNNSSDSLRRRASRGENVQQPLQWQQNRITQIQQELKSLQRKGIQ